MGTFAHEVRGRSPMALHATKRRFSSSVYHAPPQTIPVVAAVAINPQGNAPTLEWG